MVKEHINIYYEKFAMEHQSWFIKLKFHDSNWSKNLKISIAQRANPIPLNPL